MQIKYNLTFKIFLGMLLGITSSLVLKTVFPDSQFIEDYLTNGLFHIAGQIFINSLKMLVVPLVFVSLVCGVCALGDTSKLGRLGIKTLITYMITTALAITTAMIFALILKPGSNFKLNMPIEDLEFKAGNVQSLSEIFINLFPSNPIEAMASGNMLQVIVFAILFGISIALAKKSGERVVKLFEDLNSVVMRLVTLLMNLAPYGVFALMAKLFLKEDFSTISGLLKYFMVVLGVLLVHGLITYPLILTIFARLNPLMFLTKMRDVIVFAFSTATSNATIPISMETSTRKLGVKNSTAAFTIPLGATINMDGTSIMQGVATVFIAQVYGIDLTLGQYLMVILTATLASVGTAGIPSVGLITLTMVLQQVGIPIEGIALIIGVDRLLDMIRTAVNVTGDNMVTCLIAKSEQELDLKIYNDPNSGLKEESVDLKEYKDKHLANSKNTV